MVQLCNHLAVSESDISIEWLVGATAVSNELDTGSSKSVAAVGITQDGGLSVHMLNTDSAQMGQHSTVPNLGLLTKDGVDVPLSACFASAGAANAHQLLIGVSAADGTLLALSGQSVVRPQFLLPL